MTGTDQRDFAAELRGFGPPGIVAIVIILFSGNYPGVPLGALLVLLWAHLSRTPWGALGFVRPRRWVVTVLAGLAIGAALKLVMKAIVMPLLGADPVNQTYHYLAGNTAALPFAIYTMIVSAGFGEELVFRGYLFERLGRLIGTSGKAKAAVVLLTAALFGISHYANQGLPGVQQATVVGLVFGTIFTVTGQIWLLMVAHAAFDLVALAIIYWDLESAVAHLIFQ